MSGLEEDKTVWRYHVQDPGGFEKAKVREIGQGVRITLGKVKGSDRWEIESYLFEKSQFAAAEQVRSWLDSHLKGEIRTLLDFKAWNEYRRRCVNAFVNVSKVE